MGRTHRPPLRVVHAIRGRLRVHIPGWSGRGARRLEEWLRQVPGVQTARAAGLTGNVLIRFDPAATSQEAILRALRSADPDAFDTTNRSCPPILLARLRLPDRWPLQVSGTDPDSGRRWQPAIAYRGGRLPWVSASQNRETLTRRTATEVSLLALRQLAGWLAGAAGPGGLAALVLGAVALVQWHPGAREVLRGLVGHVPAELLCSGTDLLAGALSGHPLLLALAVAELVLRLARLV